MLIKSIKPILLTISLSLDNTSSDCVPSSKIKIFPLGNMLIESMATDGTILLKELNGAPGVPISNDFPYNITVNLPLTLKDLHPTNPSETFLVILKLYSG